MADDPTQPDGRQTEAIAAADGVALMAQLRFEVTGGADRGAQLGAHGPRVVVGGHESCDVRLRDPTVAGFHCEISEVDGRIWVRDLGGAAGTRVDGVSVLEAELRDGAVLCLGEVTLRVGLGGEPIAAPLSSRTSFGQLVGRSVRMRAVFAQLERVAATGATLLLHGETGTGKEAAAESVHAAGPRCDGPFVVVDCGAVPGELLESELFGHEQGAFTGAVAARTGAVEAADGGTLFLDEIGELAEELQPRLLRMLERREVKRVGAPRYRQVDVQVIAATHRDLRAEVNRGRFRADLYYRLAVVEVRIPPLRERPEDLPILVDHLLRGLPADGAHAVAALTSRDFVAALAGQAWPGNVRELRNYLERCLVLDERPPVAAPAAAADPAAAAPSFRAARDRFIAGLERRYVDELLQRHQRNVSAAARAAGVERSYLHLLIRRHGLGRP